MNLISVHLRYIKAVCAAALFLSLSPSVIPPFPCLALCSLQGESMMVFQARGIVERWMRMMNVLMQDPLHSLCLCIGFKIRVLVVSLAILLVP